jgi:hypothetical protein
MLLYLIFYKKIVDSSEIEIVKYVSYWVAAEVVAFAHCVDHRDAGGIKMSHAAVTSLCRFMKLSC